MQGLSGYGSDSESEQADAAPVHSNALNASLSQTAPKNKVSSPKTLSGIKKLNKTSSNASTPLRQKSISPPIAHSPRYADKGDLTEDQQAETLDASQKQGSSSGEWRLARFGIPRQTAAHTPDPALEAKLARYHAISAQGASMNASLQSHKSFRNPHILDILIQAHSVDQSTSNLDVQLIWDRAEMLRLGSTQELTRRQKELNEEREKKQERGKRDKISFESSSFAVAGGPSGERSAKDRVRDGLKERYAGAERMASAKRERSRSPVSSSASGSRKRDYR